VLLIRPLFIATWEPEFDPKDMLGSRSILASIVLEVG
jgi:hypothetical protein